MMPRWIIPLLLAGTLFAAATGKDIEPGKLPDAPPSRQAQRSPGVFYRFDSQFRFVPSRGGALGAGALR